MRTLKVAGAATTVLALALSAEVYPLEAAPAVAGETVSDSAPAAKKKTLSKGKLKVTRENGSTYTLRDVVLECGRMDIEPRLPTISLFGPRSAFDYEKEIIRAPFLDLEATRSAVRKGLKLKLPASSAEGARLFIGDPEGLKLSDEANELNSDQEESSGTMYVKGRCGPKSRLTLRINGVLGSEYHNAPTVAVRGTIVATRP